MNLFETILSVAIAVIIGFVTLTSGLKVVDKVHGTSSSETSAIFHMAGMEVSNYVQD